MPGKHPANKKPRLAPMIGSAALRDLAAYGISSFVKMVEPKGFEPSTSSMPSRRAPNCATAPPERKTALSFIAPGGGDRQTAGAA